MVFKSTFNNTLALLWRSVVLVVESGVPWENSCKSLPNIYHIVLYRVNSHERNSNSDPLEVIETDCIDSC